MQRHVGSVLATFLTVALADPAAASSTGHWNSLSAPGFNQCAARVVCVGAGECQDGELVLNDDCDISCTEGDVFGDFSCGAAVHTAPPDWGMLGSVGFSEGNQGVAGAAAIGGTRLSPSVFRLNASVSGGVSLPWTRPPAEIAVFRFAGDPTVFEGVKANDVDDLVALGLIEEDDVLFSTLLTVDDGGLVEEIDVTGIPDEEIVVFGAQGAALPVGVPAVGATGVLVLATILLGLGAGYAMRRRTR